MRTLVVILVLMAAGKVATVQWLHRTTTDDVIVNAYRPRALDACSLDAQRLDVAGRPAPWTAETPIRLEIGTRAVRLQVWQVDHPAWAQRFRNPYLHLEAGQAAARVRCEYDILNGTAVASKI